MKQRENLLDTEMENERERDSQRMQKEKEKDWTRKKDYAESILQQIRNNEEKRLEQMEKAHRVRLIEFVDKYRDNLR